MESALLLYKEHPKAKHDCNKITIMLYSDNLKHEMKT